MSGVSKSDQRRAKRQGLLADVAEMYFIRGMTQSTIAREIGTTPSNVSRMITDSQRLGIVKITINRPTAQDFALSDAVAKRFGLEEARAVISEIATDGPVARPIAAAGASLLRDVLTPGGSVGITWGRTLLAILTEFGTPVDNGGNVVQLAGSIGATREEHDSLSLAQRLSAAINAKPIYLSAPFIVENETISRSLSRNSANAMAERLKTQCDVIIVGVGTLDPVNGSLLASGHVSEDEAHRIAAGRAIGEVCGHPIDAEGELAEPGFSRRVMSIAPEMLRTAAVRLAVAAQPAIVPPLRAVLKKGYITHLVVDTTTAKMLLEE